MLPLMFTCVDSPMTAKRYVLPVLVLGRVIVLGRVLALVFPVVVPILVDSSTAKLLVLVVLIDQRR
jgi:hypothetical protein